MKYTFSDDEDDIYSDSTNTRRSTRNTGTHTPAEPAGPTITQSGRQVKSRQGGAYGETILSGAQAPETTVGDYDGTADEHDSDDITNGRPRRAAAGSIPNDRGIPKGGRHIEGYNHLDEMTSDEEADASEQDYGDDEEEDDVVSLASDDDDQDDLTEDDVEMEDGEKKSLVVKLPVKTPTPERKTAPKPEQETMTSKNIQPTLDVKSQAIPAPAAPTQATSTDIKEDRHSASIPSLMSLQSKPLDIAPKSPKPQPAQSPMSPSLAFRGSPEKASTFPPSIGVGSGS
jgi:hypothetical protein